MIICYTANCLRPALDGAFYCADCLRLDDAELWPEDGADRNDLADYSDAELIAELERRNLAPRRDVSPDRAGIDPAAG